MNRLMITASAKRSFASFHRRLRAACRRPGVVLETLGWVGPEKRYPLLSVKVGTGNGRPLTLVFGIHGNETSGPWAALEFLRRLKPGGSLPPLLILPAVNPWGFEMDAREDFLGNDLNRNFFKPRTAECLLVKRAMLSAKSGAVLSFHEDDELDEAYFYAYGGACGSRLIAALKRAAGRHLSRRKNIYGAPARSGVIRGLADGSLEHAASTWGVSGPVCCEVPDSLPLKRRVKLVLRMIEAACKAFV